MVATEEPLPVFGKTDDCRSRQAPEQLSGMANFVSDCRALILLRYAGLGEWATKYCRWFRRRSSFGREESTLCATPHIHHQELRVLVYVSAGLSITSFTAQAHLICLNY